MTFKVPFKMDSFVRAEGKKEAFELFNISLKELESLMRFLHYFVKLSYFMTRGHKKLLKISTKAEEERNIE